MDKLELLEDPGMQEILQSFLVESKEILEKLDNDLMVVEKTPDDKELVNQIFRHFHTIKGTSGFFGLEKLPVITHHCEDILNKIRKDEFIINSSIMDSILKATDKIKMLITSIEVNHNEDVEISAEVTDLDNILNGRIEQKSEDKKDEKKEEKQPITINNVVNEKTIRVDIERLDDLLNITSEIVLGRNRLFQVSSEASFLMEGSKISRDLSELSKQIDFMTNELQLIVMKLRMIKIGKLFNKFPRLVRDLSKETGKNVEIIMKGEDTELDKTLIEEIHDPLVHIIRNSLDHGIELPDERELKGKNKKGLLSLSAEQSGNNIFISIQDDGRGLDSELIKQKAIAKGIISSEKAAEMSRQEILNLIFLPGFSTKEVASNLSGRGVGMDVVKTNVAKLRGTIILDSNKDEGTSIKIRLPLTLAIIQGLIVRNGGENLVIPLNSVVEVLRLQEDSGSINQVSVIQIRDEIIPLLNLDHMFVKRNNEKKEYAVIVTVAEKKFGLLVNELVGQKEIVIKPLGSYLGNVKGIAGSTIMGDGSVIMILDMAEIMNSLYDARN